MTSLDERRRALADAVTGTGKVTCLPYPQDSLAAPIAYVAAIGISYGAGMLGTFCAPGTASAVVTVIEQRNDLPGAIASLEALIPDVVAALSALDDVLVTAVEPDFPKVDNQSLPAIDITVQFPA